MCEMETDWSFRNSRDYQYWVKHDQNRVSQQNDSQYVQRVFVCFLQVMAQKKSEFLFTTQSNVSPRNQHEYQLHGCIGPEVKGEL